MNDLYFACTDCKIIADCGYRWAYWHLLHPGIVQLRQRVEVERVLSAKDYWHPPSQPNSTWLHDEVFPAVRTMLADHGKHNLMFWQIDDKPNEWWLDWLDLGAHPEPTARFLAEIDMVQDWDGALARLRELDRVYWRADDDSAKERFRQAFERHRAAVRPAK